MRKFNLKGTVIQRMRGIERETPKAPEDEKEQVKVNTEMYAGFTSAQGQIRCAWRTDVGKLRKNNQDAVILGNGLAGVADGMGGHKGGEIASAGLRDGLLRETRDCLPDVNRLQQAVATVNRELWEQQEKELHLQRAMLDIRKRYGAGAVFKARSLMEGATALERIGQIGGHRA